MDKTVGQNLTVRSTSEPACSGGHFKSSISLPSFDGQQSSSFNLAKGMHSALATFNVPLHADENPSSLASWIRLIREAWSRGTGSTLELAQLVSQARRSLPYGGWSRLWQSGDLPFSKRKGEKLVVIGQGLEGIDANDCSHLPAAWSTLYCLARLGRMIVDQLIEQGRIHPGLSLREAKMLLAEHRPETQRKDSRSKLQDRLARFARFIRQELGSWSLAERKFASGQLTVLAVEIHRAAPLADAHNNERPAISSKASDAMRRATGFNS